MCYLLLSQIVGRILAVLRSGIWLDVQSSAGYRNLRAGAPGEASWGAGRATAAEHASLPWVAARREQSGVPGARDSRLRIQARAQAQALFARQRLVHLLDFEGVGA